MRQFCELLPAVKSEFDSSESEVHVFETLGSYSTILDQVKPTSSRLDELQNDIRDMIEVDQVWLAILSVDPTYCNLSGFKFRPI